VVLEGDDEQKGGSVTEMGLSSQKNRRSKKPLLEEG